MANLYIHTCTFFIKAQYGIPRWLQFQRAICWPVNTTMLLTNCILPSCNPICMHKHIKELCTFVASVAIIAVFLHVGTCERWALWQWSSWGFLVRTNTTTTTSNSAFQNCFELLHTVGRSDWTTLFHLPLIASQIWSCYDLCHSFTV